eukprot:m.55667 g.55667  ORF g.55667 m.55667 type:complete len:357 (-) comp11138_c1_seq2:102-1172(-)
MSDRRYLTTRNAPTPPQFHEQVDDFERKRYRSVRERKDLVGYAGIIENRKRKYAPFAKRWTQSYNMQAQEDVLLAETMPTGLRKKKSCVFITVVVILLLLNIITLSMVIWFFDVWRVDEYGVRGFVIRGNSVGFTRDFNAEQLFVSSSGDSGVARVIDSPSSVSLTSNEVRLHTFSTLRQQSSDISVDSNRVLLNTTLLALNNGANDVFSGTIEQSVVASEQFSIEGTLHTDSLSASVFRPDILDSMEVTSTLGMNLSSFAAATVESSRGTTTVRADGDIVFTVTNTIQTITNFITSSWNSNDVTLNMRDMLFPDAVPLTGQDSFALCACDSGVVYAVQGNVTCAETTNQYLSTPC